MTAEGESPSGLTLRDNTVYGGTAGALAPFALFVAGVAALALSGAPAERGFWPVLLAAITLGLALAKDRHAYCETVLEGMSRRIVLLMVMAWLLAGVFGTLMRAAGLVDALVWLARQAEVSGAGFVVAAFFVCCAVSTATGTSLGTLILCAPLLYPAGVALGAHPAVLIGAVLGGATFGDNVSPVSDTTIASAATQDADLGGVVRSRLRYALPAAGLALVAYLALGGGGDDGSATGVPVPDGSPAGLPMLLAPALVVVLLLRRRHLIEGLLAGIVAATVLGLALGLLAPTDLLYVDAEAFGARGLVVDGVERGLGVSVFTLLLMGLLAALEATGVLDRLLASLEARTRTARGAEGWIFTAVSVAALLTTHSVVAILAVGPFTRRAGERFGIGAYRRSNLLDVTVCTYPFLLPYCIPTILAASLTAGTDLPRISPLAAGLYNFHSWALLAVIVVAILTGWGRGVQDSPGGGGHASLRPGAAPP
ncbi:MAG: sodium:proton antiporter [bacterium]|nr:sodium:proton antiporter [bacterium]